MQQENLPQKQAVEHISGPMLVLAGPGSGKTFVITHRVVHLIESGIDPGEILVITFTNAAAKEMKERFLSLRKGDPSAAQVTFGTFHSVFFRILSMAYGYTGANIIREEKKRALLQESLRNRMGEGEEREELLSSLIGEIGRVKEERINPGQYHSLSCADEVFQGVYQDYEKTLRRERLIDFEDMLVFTLELLQKRPDIRDTLSRKYRYLLIDEFQDINPIQYETVKLLAKPENNLFIVGDDDQSIYQFRGARPEIMLSFPQDYPGCRQVVLETNYRSCGAILQAAGALITHNKVRYEKQVKANKGEGDPVVFREFDTMKEQNDAICQEIIACHERGIPFEEIAVLVRTNTQPRLLLGSMMNYNLPFTSQEKIPSLYDHWITKTVLAYFHFANGDTRRKWFLQLMNRPNRYLSRENLPDANVDMRKLLLTYNGKDWMQERIIRLQQDLRFLAGKAPYAAMTYLGRKMEFVDYIKEFAAQRGADAEELLNTWEELRESAKSFSTWESWEQSLLSLKEAAQKKAEDPEKKGVQILTMHKSKGLEYEVVFIPDSNEGVTPYRKAFLPADMEEERRMYYVAMTRAKTNLFCFYARERFGKETNPSRFLLEAGANLESRTGKESKSGE